MQCGHKGLGLWSLSELPLGWATSALWWEECCEDDKEEDDTPAAAVQLVGLARHIY